MRKYWFVFSLYWQEGLQQRASFFMERFRALVVLISFYYFWTTLLDQRGQFAGYDRTQMLTYVFGMNVLRGLIFSGRTYEISWEINHGRVSPYLLKPVDFMLYAFFRDLSEKSINFLSAIIEVIGLSILLGADLRWPEYWWTWGLFTIALAMAAILYFCLSFMVGCWGFWTAESGGPRFLLELILEFSAGAFFPLDVLPGAVQTVLKAMPSPYMVFFPLHVFLEKLSAADLLTGFGIQLFWVVALATLARWVWNRGVAAYEAQGG